MEATSFSAVRLFDSFSSRPEVLVDGPCWNVNRDDDRELSDDIMIRERVCQLKRIFHYDRKLCVKNLPRNATENDIRQLIQNLGILVGQVQLIRSTGSCSARVGLVDPSPDFWEQWEPKSLLLRGHRLSVAPCGSDNLLCVARLPRDCREAHFRHLVSVYGETKRSFLMCSENTGESKGYGFVEYVDREVALRARASLNGRSYQGHVLICDWLDSSIVRYSELHSKLLYVDNIPPGFRDMGELRKLFSTVGTPPYCQIALRGGAPQDWGLVEFTDSQEAEDTQLRLNSFPLRGSRLRVAFYIPGVRAINIYMKLLSEENENKGKAALLPEPPVGTVLQQLTNLTKQNPAFVQSLHNIITEQIQSLQKKSTVQDQSQTQNKSAAVLAANARATLSLLTAAQHPDPRLSFSNQTTDITVPPPPLGHLPLPGTAGAPLIQPQDSLTTVLKAFAPGFHPSSTSPVGVLISLLLKLLQGGRETGKEYQELPSYRPSSSGASSSRGSSPTSTTSPSSSPLLTGPRFVANQKRKFSSESPFEASRSPVFVNYQNLSYLNNLSEPSSKRFKPN